LDIAVKTTTSKNEVTTMTHPIGYFTSYNPQTQEPDALHKLQERFNSRLEKMSYEQKIVFRAALAGFIAEKPVWQEDTTFPALMAALSQLVWIGAVWDEDPELVAHIQACSQLEESDIEG
jgi:hypothetical protein